LWLIDLHQPCNFEHEIRFAGCGWFHRLYRVGFVMHKKLESVIRVGVLAVGVVYGVAASAQKSTYNYEGNSFTQVDHHGGLFTTDDYVSAWFTLDCSVAHEAATCESLSYSDYYALGAVTLEPLSFRAGPAELPTAEGQVEVARFYLATDSQGNITTWDIDLFLYSPTGIINVDTDNVDGGIDSAAALGNGGSVYGNPGVWKMGDPQPIRYKVTIFNWTAGQTFAPPLLITHAQNYSIFKPAMAASEGLAILAESGATGALLDEAGDAVTAAVTADEPVGPGQKVTMTITGNPGRDFISLAAMLLPTNDTFVALRPIPLSGGGTVLKKLYAWDAGTEHNSESCQHIPGPYCGGEGYSAVSGEGVVSISRGLHGTGGTDEQGFEILDARQFDWNNPVARIAITRIR
jgi:Spondin_N